jgi:hypothetical protein
MQDAMSRMMLQHQISPILGRDSDRCLQGQSPLSTKRFKTQGRASHDERKFGVTLFAVTGCGF